MKYLKIFTDFAPSLEMLGDVEAGRLFKAMLKYAESGEDTELRGNERFLWTVAKSNIDRERKMCEILSTNGKQGGRPPKNQKKPNETKENQTKPKKSQQEKRQEQEQEKRQELLLSPLPPSLSKGEDKKKDDPLSVDPDLKEIIRLWDRASGRIMTGWESSEIVELLDSFGKERLTQAITAAAANNSVKINYVRAVLENRGKKTPAADLKAESNADLDAWLAEGEGYE